MELLSQFSSNTCRYLSSIHQLGPHPVRFSVRLVIEDLIDGNFSDLSLLWSCAQWRWNSLLRNILIFIHLRYHKIFKIIMVRLDFSVKVLKIDREKNWMYKNTDYEAFFHQSQTFGLGQTIWADKFWGIWGIFSQFISIHFGTVSPLSMFSINQPLFLQKN